MTGEKLIVVYDTFCGWCYGASQVFDTLLETDAEIEVLHRHLFQGENAPRMRDGKGAQILQTIPDVETLTGQKFSEAFKAQIVGSETEVLESGLSAQAAALVHGQGAEKEFAVRRRLEKLHFGQGISSSDRQAIVETLVAEGISPEQAERIGTPELAAEAARISGRAKNIMAAVGSHGVPTVIKVNGETAVPVNHQAFYGRAQEIASDLSNLATL